MNGLTRFPLSLVPILPQIFSLLLILPQGGRFSLFVLQFRSSSTEWLSEPLSDSQVSMATVEPLPTVPLLTSSSLHNPNSSVLSTVPPPPFFPKTRSNPSPSSDDAPSSDPGRSALPSAGPALYPGDLPYCQRASSSCSSSSILLISTVPSSDQSSSSQSEIPLLALAAAGLSSSSSGVQLSSSSTVLPPPPLSLSAQSLPSSSSSPLVPAPPTAQSLLDSAQPLPQPGVPPGRHSSSPMFTSRPVLPEPSSSAAALLPRPSSSAYLISAAPQHQSYAQAARTPRGPGFVRAHASAVESFARLPRTGTNIICGSREGIPSFSFVMSELPRVEALYSNALVMKFYGGRPSLELSHKEISSWGIAQPFSIGPLTSRAFLLRFQDNTDLLRVLTRPSSSLITYPYKIYRWHNLCHMKEDSCLAPVWITLPKLPLQCFIPEFLEAVGNKIGRFLCFDKATSTLARPSAARLCVEIDLRNQPPQFIWIGLFDGFKQQIIYEKMAKYCIECHIQGHTSVSCSKNHLDNPPIAAEAKTAHQFRRTPGVRQIATTNPATSIQPNTSPVEPHSYPDPILKAPPLPVNSHPVASSTPTLNVYADSHPVVNPPLTAYPQLAPSVSGVCHNAAGSTSISAIDSEQNYATVMGSDDSRVCRPISLNQPPLQSLHPLSVQDASERTPSVRHKACNLTSPAIPESLVEGLHPGTNIQSTVAKSIKLKPYDVSNSSSLSPQQAEALERFKSKVKKLAQIPGQQIIGPTIANPFEALLHAQSEEDDDSVASYNSDTDDGLVEPLDMGYQSADGRSSNKHKNIAPASMKINKRHPNIPLNVRLRARKSSYPSTP